MNKFTNELQIICIASLAAAFVYGLALPFFWGNNPLLEHGTLSLLCEDRKAYFWLWGILTSGSIFINTKYMQERFMIKSKSCEILGSFAVIFATVGKSGLMEMVPLALIEVFLFVINFTPAFVKSKLQSEAEKATN